MSTFMHHFYYNIKICSPLPCPSGTFNPYFGIEDVTACLPCLPGMSCTTVALTYPNDSCRPGYYCPPGLAIPYQYPCNGGTYTDSYNLTKQTECDMCPASYVCVQGTGGIANPPSICPAGYFCPNGTSV